LATAGDIAAETEDSAEAGLRSPLGDTLVELLINQQLGAADADAVEHIENVGKELNEIDRACKLVMAEMTRATMICLCTAAARLTIVQHTHTRIKETSNARLISIVCATICDFYDGTSLNLFRTENPELDTHHGLDIRIWTMHTSGHFFSVREMGF
jgi:hypothetical protein